MDRLAIHSTDNGSQSNLTDDGLQSVGIFKGTRSIRGLQKRARSTDWERWVDLFEDFFKANRQRKAMTSDRLCESVLQFIVVGNLSFRQAENPKLRDLLSEAFPSCTLLNQRSVVQRLKSETQLARGNLRDQLDLVDGKVSLALDAWHSEVGNMEFLGTSHILGIEMIRDETGKSPPWR